MSAAPTVPAKLHMCVNRFELINPWGQPVDKEWALRQLCAWLDTRMDVIEGSDYHAGVQTKGDTHVRPD